MNNEFVTKMRIAGKLAGATLAHVGTYVTPGITTKALDQIANDYIIKNGGVPANVGYNGFPATICASNNTMVCHGVPSDDALKWGDILKIDLAVIVDGHFGDTCKTFIVGKPHNPSNKDFVEVAYQAMMKGIEVIKPGVTAGDIGFAVNKYATRRGYSTVKLLGGHGIGTKYHIEPTILYEGKKGRGHVYKAWECITVEPMLNMGNEAVEQIDIPGSSIKAFKTVDNSLSAQFEHTILITDTGYEILTLP